MIRPSTLAGIAALWVTATRNRDQQREYSFHDHFHFVQCFVTGELIILFLNLRNWSVYLIIHCVDNYTNDDTDELSRLHITYIYIFIFSKFFIFHSFSSPLRAVVSADLSANFAPGHIISQLGVASFIECSDPKFGTDRVDLEPHLTISEHVGLRIKRCHTGTLHPVIQRDQRLF
ncbi:hypothetical protein K4K60_006277 [Colletotrichum sp. SAR11_57]|nr:hypothetical protein K4K60_006277 [Colletotrichum sp. SAR11_57]